MRCAGRLVSLLPNERHPFPTSLFSSRFVPSCSGFEKLSLIGVQTPITVAPAINFSTRDPAVLKPRVCSSVRRLLFYSGGSCRPACYLCVICAVIYYTRVSLLEGVSPRGGEICSNHPGCWTFFGSGGLDSSGSSSQRSCSTKSTRSVIPLRQRVSQPSFRKMVVPTDPPKFCIKREFLVPWHDVVIQSYYVQTSAHKLRGSYASSLPPRYSVRSFPLRQTDPEGASMTSLARMFGTVSRERLLVSDCWIIASETGGFL